MSDTITTNGSFTYINGFCAGPDYTSKEHKHRSYQISTPTHGGKIVVYGEEELRDKILNFLQYQ